MLSLNFCNKGILTLLNLGCTPKCVLCSNMCLQVLGFPVTVIFVATHVGSISLAISGLQPSFNKEK